MMRLLFISARDTAFASLISTAILVLLTAVWVSIVGEMSPGFWNPLSRHVQYELDAPRDSPDVAVLVREVGRWLEDRGESCVIELRDRDGSAWLALACRRAADLQGLRTVFLRSGLLDTRVRIGFEPEELLQQMASQGPPRQMQPFLAVLFLTNAAGFLVIASWRRGQQDDRELADGWEQPRASSTSRLAYAVCGGIVLAASMAALQGLLGSLGFDQDRQPILEVGTGLQGLAYVVFALAVVGLAPISEELFFRGHLFRSFAVAGRTEWAYVCSSLFFALMHFYPSLLPSYLVAGLGLAWLYEHTRWIGTPIIAHAVVNATGLWVWSG